MPHTKWKQDFFLRIPPIEMRDKLASTLGAVEDGEIIYYSYADCVKLAGHACASVSSAFQMTKIALKALYGDDVPVRGDISVRFGGDRTSGANGPIGQVIQFITGAAIETGFHGLSGKFSRADNFQYDEMLEADKGIVAEFKRLGTNRTVTVHADPSMIPMTNEEKSGAVFMNKVVDGTASAQEREKFYAFWQGKNRKILLEEHGAFTVEPQS
jgi:hypothetical protein